MKKVEIAKKLLKRNDVITVIGKRWFDKVNGNTYHSSKVYVNGNEIGYQPFIYGYGDSYQQTGLELLKEKYDILDDVTMLWGLKNHGIKLVTSVSDGLKRDL